jgi:hypothetical protein
MFEELDMIMAELDFVESKMSEKLDQFSYPKKPAKGEKLRVLINSLENDSMTE